MAAAAAASLACGRMADSTVRFSDVAQFVGLSLRNPKPAGVKPSTQPSIKKSTSSRGGSDSVRHWARGECLWQVDAGQKSRQLGAKKGTDVQSRSCSSLPQDKAMTELPRSAMHQSLSLPSIAFGPPAQSSQPPSPQRRKNQQQAQAPPLPWSQQPQPQQALSAQAREEVRKSHAELKTMDKSVSNLVKTHQKYSIQVGKTQERVEYHRRRLKHVDDTIAKLEKELRAGEQAALEVHLAEKQAEIEQERLELQRRAQRSAAMLSAPKEAEPPRARALAPAPPPQAVFPSVEDSQPSASPAESSDVAPAAEVASENQAAKSFSEAAPVIQIMEQGGGSSGSTALPAPTNAGQLPVPKDGSVKGGGSERSASNAHLHVPDGTPSAAERSPSKDTTTSSKTPGILKHMAEGKIITPTLEMFESEKELLRYQQEVIRRELVKNAGSSLAAFKAINLNGSGNICSQEFADGVKRLGIPWQQLTGLKKPRQLFKIFDLERTGVISFYELFPADRNKARDDSGMTTPDFWKRWAKQNLVNGCGGPQWGPGSPDDELKRLYGNTEKNEESALQHKWISKTFRRMKFMGKSDARVREMVALHLPRGSGPEDLQGVKTFSPAEVVACKRVYSDAVLEPQRTVTKAIEDLKEHRRSIHASRQKLWVVSVGSHSAELARLAAEKSGHDHGLSIAIKKDEDADGAHDAVQEQASFRELAMMTGMEQSKIEDVFRTWMRHSDKTETIYKKQFHKLLEDLCPQRTIGENDLAAWWDQIHLKSFAECLNVDWTAVDDKYHGWNKASLGAKCQQELALARKTPATFDMFMTWWCMSELRKE